MNTYIKQTICCPCKQFLGSNIEEIIEFLGIRSLEERKLVTVTRQFFEEYKGIRTKITFPKELSHESFPATTSYVLKEGDWILAYAPFSYVIRNDAEMKTKQMYARIHIRYYDSSRKELPLSKDKELKIESFDKEAHSLFLEAIRKFIKSGKHGKYPADEKELTTEIEKNLSSDNNCWTSKDGCFIIKY